MCQHCPRTSHRAPAGACAHAPAGAGARRTSLVALVARRSAARRSSLVATPESSRPTSQQNSLSALLMIPPCSSDSRTHRSAALRSRRLRRSVASLRSLRLLESASARRGSVRAIASHAAAQQGESTMSESTTPAITTLPCSPHHRAGGTARPRSRQPATAMRGQRRAQSRRRLRLTRWQSNGAVSQRARLGE